VVLVIWIAIQITISDY